MKRAWNLPNLPVYSVATYRDGRVNMNICTYVAPVSRQPKRYIISVYQGTETLRRLKVGQPVVLQLLSTQHIDLVLPLGKKSGAKTDKHTYLSKRGRLELWHKYLVLSDCAALVELEPRTSSREGDHTLFVCDVLRSRSFDRSVLMLDHLREKRFIVI